MSSIDSPIRIAVVGVGKIVRDQHLPALAKDSAFKLVAAASRNGKVDGVPNYPSIEDMLSAGPEIDAVSLCMPPQVRYAAARTALEAGKHVFLEKPPGATVSEVEHLKTLAASRGDATRTSAFCARCRSAWSTSTQASIASAIGVARMPTHGSWRPCVLTITARPDLSIECRSSRIDDVGLTAIATTMSCPVEMPPRMPPA